MSVGTSGSGKGCIRQGVGISCGRELIEEETGPGAGIGAGGEKNGGRDQMGTNGLRN